MALLFPCIVLLAVSSSSVMMHVAQHSANNGPTTPLTSFFAPGRSYLPCYAPCADLTAPVIDNTRQPGDDPEKKFLLDEWCHDVSKCVWRAVAACSCC